jgi:hypothetical protein
VNPGVGDLYVGGMWLAAIIINGPEVPISVSDALSSQYIGSPPCMSLPTPPLTNSLPDRAPEMTETAELTTKVSFPLSHSTSHLCPRWTSIPSECVSSPW